MPINPEFSNTTKNLRPDAVTFDQRTVFTLGPVAQGDTTQGIINYAWKVRHDVDNLRIYVARRNDANDGWNNETLLFTYTGTTLVEIDAAFDQSGRVFVCGDRDGSVWAYYYNPTIPGFAFEEMGTGRNPRAIIDNPRNTSESDIILFYMNEDVDKLCYRQQRDRYQTEYETPVTLIGTKYLEDATRTKTNRLQIYYSDRNLSTGRYTLKILLTTLYPYLSDPDAYSATLEFLGGGTLVVVLIEYGADIEKYSAEHEMVDGVLFEPLILHTLYDKDAYSAEHAFNGDGTLVDSTIQNVLDPDQYSADHGFNSGGTLLVVIIQHALYDKDTQSAEHTFRSGGTLV